MRHWHPAPKPLVLVYSFILLRGDSFRISIALPPRASTEAVRAELVDARQGVETATTGR